jgi:tetratricopeptide (TPR) repeat protein
LERIAQFADNRLNAQIGLMRCYYKLKNFQKALEYANRVKVMEKADTDLIEEARIIIARSAFEQNDPNQAFNEFQWVEQNSKNIFKAEAKYYIALIYFNRGEYENSQKKIFDLLQNLPSYKSWGNKALLLLARNYWALDDIYQANYTLDQIIARVDDPELVQEARKMKEDIVKMQENKEAERRRYEEFQNHIDSVPGPSQQRDNNE